MITSKHITAITAIFLCLALILTGTVFVLPDSSSDSSSASTPEYASKVFGGDILTLNISVDETEWQTMLQNATEEEYIPCDLTVNGVTFASVGIRPKGNSSLSSVASDDTTDRFSFKIKFDEYVKGQTCYGLDKMVVNNMQSDATYMKEYLSYQLCGLMGISTPLYTYTSISVNGEAWGFYLAVECLESSFAERNYGSDYGMLYKPESMGERGNGKMNEFLEQQNNDDTDTTQSGSGTTNSNGTPPADSNAADTTGSTSSQSGNNMGGNANGSPPQMPDGAGNGGPGGMGQQNGNAGSPPDMAGGTSDGAQTGTDNTVSGSSDATQSSDNNANGFGGMQAGGFGGSSGQSGGCDLVYTDDSISSYSAIFNNAIFNSDDEDYERVITALKNLNDGTELEKYINVDEVLRYFAINTALVNLDSYVSSLEHNYYLYEENGQLSILPWDYNLSFAGFQSGSSSSAVNFPIDTPVSGVSLSERPLLGKLLEVDEYKELYHKYLQEIVDNYFNNGLFETTVQTLNAQISDYVKNDPSAFYTYEEYESAVPMLITFGKLRAESIEGQLNGTIPSTEDGQSNDSSALIDASSLNLTTLGSQGGGGGGGGMGGNMMGGGGMPAGDNMVQGQNAPAANNSTNTDTGSAGAADTTGTGDAAGGNSPGGAIPGSDSQTMMDSDTMQKAFAILQEASGDTLSDEQKSELEALGLSDDEITRLQSFSGGGNAPGGQMQNGQSGNTADSSTSADSTQAASSSQKSSTSSSLQSNFSSQQILLSGICLLLLLGGLIFVFFYRRKR